MTSSVREILQFPCSCLIRRLHPNPLLSPSNAHRFVWRSPPSVASLILSLSLFCLSWPSHHCGTFPATSPGETHTLGGWQTTRDSHFSPGAAYPAATQRSVELLVLLDTGTPCQAGAPQPRLALHTEILLVSVSGCRRTRHIFLATILRSFGALSFCLVPVYRRPSCLFP